MSNHIAREVLSRLSGAASLVSMPHAQHAAEDLQMLARVTDASLENAAAEIRMSHLLDAYGYDRAPDATQKPFAYADGVAIIPVHGTLINRFAYSWGFVTGYNFIRKQKNLAKADPDVKLIVYDVNSYGGEAAACFELADEIRGDRDEKPSLAVVDTNCCSAAYALASAAGRLVVTPSGQAGSIGVIAMHMSLQGALEQAGIEVTIFSQGARKADGNPFKRLSREAAQEIEVDIEKSYAKFVDLVSKNRDLDEGAIRDTESRSYRADDALALNLIDAVMTPTDAVNSFLAEMGNDEPADNEDDEPMATTPAPGAAPTGPTPEQAAATAASNAQLARVKGILTHAEAKNRPTLANHLALETEMTVDAAAGILAASAVETPVAAAPAAAAAAAPAAAATPAPAAAATPAPAAGAGALTALMDADKTPAVGADGAAAAGADGEVKPSRARMAMQSLGYGPKKGEAAATSH